MLPNQKNIQVIFISLIYAQTLATVIRICKLLILLQVRSTNNIELRKYLQKNISETPVSLHQMWNPFYFIL